ncbi:hypothetical protein SNEBB_011313 [Seison nebaliae]|nr:hypothetical protein SNEBB_011313 [Seison nebaliae]
MSNVTIITGASSGIGLAIVKLLIGNKERRQIVCLACRNEKKTLKIIDDLSSEVSEGNVLEFVELDTSNLRSVEECVGRIKEKYERIDNLILNAGIMPVDGINVGAVLKSFVDGTLMYRCLSGDGYLRQKDFVTSDNLQGIFATNVFGHLYLVEGLMKMLRNETNDTRVIFMSSENALRSNFNFSDIQHKNGTEPYGSSKFLLDSLSISLNKTMGNENLHFYSTSPGLVMTKITENIMPPVLWFLLMPIFLFVNIFTNNIVRSPNYAATVYQSILKLSMNSDIFSKYHARLNVFNRPYYQITTMKISDEDSMWLHGELMKMIKSVKKEHLINTKKKATEEAKE